MKKCSICKELKLESEFHKNSLTANTKRGGLCYHCKACNVLIQRKHRFGKIGFSIPEYKAMYEAQKGKCLFCHSPKPMYGLHVDHNHANGKIRGLLCVRCNYFLGMIKEDISKIEYIIEYLKRNL